MGKIRYSCDFETTTDPNDCRVWAYGWMQVGKTSRYEIGNSLEEFMQWAEKCDGILYFHNLKFDGEFIVNWLLHNGYKEDDSGKPKTFTTVISSMGQWYAIDICYGYRKKKKLHTTIYDSLKKLPYPVKVIAKAFNLEIMKGDIDYDAPRPIGHIITDEEHAYIKNDIQIVAEALDVQFKQGLDRLTNGSDSLKGFKDSISKKQFEKWFPILSLETDTDIRKAYRGGFTWLNDRFKNKEVGEGIVYDVNSLYPAQMYTRLLPVGRPIFFNGQYQPDKKYPLFIQHIRCQFEIKEGFIPTIQIKKNLRFQENEYLKSSNGEIVDLYMTNIDLEMFFDHYEVVDLEYCSGYMFRGQTGMFKEFIDYWTAIKTTSEGAIKSLAKLQLNSLYGKFASNPDVTGKYPYLKEDGSTGFRLKEKEFRDPVYTPMGVFITSWARYTTISTAQKCYDRIIYCDTDSIHLTGLEVPEAIKDIIHPKALGMWAYEGAYAKAKYIRQKTYYHVLYAKTVDGKVVECDKEEHDTFKHVVKCAGMPDKVKSRVTFETFQVGFSSLGKLRPKHVRGGVVLEDSVFTIK